MQINKVSAPSYNPKFNAINQKYFKKAKEACITSGDLYEHLFCLENAVAFKSISPQDALDTLKALLPYAKEHHLRLFKKYEEIFEYFKELYSKEDWSNFLAVRAPRTVPVVAPTTEPIGP